MEIIKDYGNEPQKDNILKRALEQIAREESEEFDRILADADLDSITFSNNFKRRMNALFLELGFDHVPHPEVEPEIKV